MPVQLGLRFTHLGVGFYFNFFLFFRLSVLVFPPCIPVMKCYGGTALLDKGLPPGVGRMIPTLLFSLQDVHQFSSLPTFPSAAMQCQRWLQAQALAQSLTLPQPPGSGEQHENTWPLSQSCCSLPACSRRELQGGVKVLLLCVSMVSLLGKVGKSKSQSQVPVSVSCGGCWQKKKKSTTK